MTTKIEGQLEIDHKRGVIYFHSNESGFTHLRICNLPKPIPELRQTLDVAYNGPCDWRGEFRDKKSVIEDKVNKLDDMDFKEFNLKLYNLFKAGCAAREKMFNGNRTEAMRLYKLIGEDLRMWGEYLKKLVY